MSDPLSMSLDDIIKGNKKSGSTSPRGGRPSSGLSLARRFPKRTANHTGPYMRPKHDLYSDQGIAFSAQPGRAFAIETGTKLYISNLEYGISNEDIKDCLSLKLEGNWKPLGKVV